MRWLMALFLGLSLSLPAAETEKVVVEGMGPSVKIATKNAIRAALRQVVGMYVVTDTVVQNRKLIKDEILSYSKGYVKSYKILDKTEKYGIYTVEVLVEIEKEKLTTTLGKLNIAVKKLNTEEKEQLSAHLQAVREKARQQEEEAKKKEMQAQIEREMQQNFAKILDKVVIQPLIDRSAYEVQLISFKPFDIEKEKSSIFSNPKAKSPIPIAFISDTDKELYEEKAISLYEIHFQIGLSEVYWSSLKHFLDKAADRKTSVHRKDNTVELLYPRFTRKTELSKYIVNPRKIVSYSKIKGYDLGKNKSVFDEQFKKAAQKPLKIKIGFFNRDKEEVGILTYCNTIKYYKNNYEKRISKCMLLLKSLSQYERPSIYYSRNKNGYYIYDMNHNLFKNTHGIHTNFLSENSSLSASYLMYFNFKNKKIPVLALYDILVKQYSYYMLFNDINYSKFNYYEDRSKINDFNYNYFFKHKTDLYVYVLLAPEDAEAIMDGEIKIELE